MSRMRFFYLPKNSHQVKTHIVGANSMHNLPTFGRDVQHLHSKLINALKHPLQWKFTLNNFCSMPKRTTLLYTISISSISKSLWGKIFKVHWRKVALFNHESRSATIRNIHRRNIHKIQHLSTTRHCILSLTGFISTEKLY